MNDAHRGAVSLLERTAREAGKRAAEAISFSEARRVMNEGFVRGFVDGALVLAEGNIEVAAARVDVSERYFRLLRRGRHARKGQPGRIGG